MARYLYSELARLVQARKNCEQRIDTKAEAEWAIHSDPFTWFYRHEEHIEQLVKEHMPSGSGFDSGTSIDLDISHAGKLVFNTSFHHMYGESGMYDGWTEHGVTVTPAFDGFNTRVSGRDRNRIKNYIREVFDIALERDLTEQIEYERLCEKLGDRAVTFESRWKDQCTQEWLGTRRTSAF